MRMQGEVDGAARRRRSDARRATATSRGHVPPRELEALAELRRSRTVERPVPPHACTRRVIGVSWCGGSRPRPGRRLTRRDDVPRQHRAVT